MKRFFGIIAISLVVMGLIAGCVGKNTRTVFENNIDNVELGITLGAHVGLLCSMDDYSQDSVEKCIKKEIEGYGYNYMNLDVRRKANGMKPKKENSLEGPVTVHRSPTAVLSAFYPVHLPPYCLATVFDPETKGTGSELVKVKPLTGYASDSLLVYLPKYNIYHGIKLKDVFTCGEQSVIDDLIESLDGI